MRQKYIKIIFTIKSEENIIKIENKIKTKNCENPDFKKVFDSKNIQIIFVFIIINTHLWDKHIQLVKRHFIQTVQCTYERNTNKTHARALADMEPYLLNSHDYLIKVGAVVAVVAW